MSEFNVGDKVRVSAFPRRNKGVPVDDSLAGAEVTIRGKDRLTGDWVVDFDGEDVGWFVGGDSLTLVEDAPDMVNHPSHYTSDPSGVECITITRHRNFNIGNAIKYLWRAGLKGDEGKNIEDLRKAVFYINDEIARLEGERS